MANANLFLLPEKFQKKIMPIPECGCWIWTGCWSRKSYGVAGVVSANGRGGGKHAHCVIYELLVGPIPNGLQLDHLCRIKPCVNPDHLEPVTNIVNQERNALARTHCKWGHPFSGDNVKTRKRPRRGLDKIGFRTERECVICMRGAQRRRLPRTRCSR
jgi:hypothetical protein